MMSGARPSDDAPHWSPAYLAHAVSDTIAKVAEHERWRSGTLNMSAAESMTIPAVRAVLGSDFARRYAIPQFYPGSSRFESLRADTEALARAVFRAQHADVRAPTGQVALLSCLVGLCKPSDTVLLMNPADGGQPVGLLQWCGMDVRYLPFDHQTLRVSTERAVGMIREVRPRLVMVGSSVIPFPPPTGLLVEACREAGALLCYDGSHVMGLIAGGAFPNPLDDGADVLVGSTNKTLSGPLGGLILSNDARLFCRASAPLGLPPFFVSNFNPAHVVALRLVLADTWAFGAAFAAQIVRNSQALAAGLHSAGLPVVPNGPPHTESHQVIVRFDQFESARAKECQRRLEASHLLVDATIRLGTQEITRLGMTEADMREIAGLISDAWQERRDSSAIREDVARLTAQHQRIEFTHAKDGDGYVWKPNGIFTDPNGKSDA